MKIEEVCFGPVGSVWASDQLIHTVEVVVELNANAIPLSAVITHTECGQLPPSIQWLFL